MCCQYRAFLCQSTCNGDRPLQVGGQAGLFVRVFLSSSYKGLMNAGLPCGIVGIVRLRCSSCLCRSSGYKRIDRQKKDRGCHGSQSCSERWRPAPFSDCYCLENSPGHGVGIGDAGFMPFFLSRALVPDCRLGSLVSRSVRPSAALPHAA